MSSENPTDILSFPPMKNLPVAPLQVAQSFRDSEGPSQPTSWQLATAGGGCGD